MREQVFLEGARFAREKCRSEEVRRFARSCTVMAAASLARRASVNDKMARLRVILFSIVVQTAPRSVNQAGVPHIFSEGEWYKRRAAFA